MYSGRILAADVVQLLIATYTVPSDCALHVAQVHEEPLAFVGMAATSSNPSGGIGVLNTPAVLAAGTLTVTDITSVLIKLLPFY